MQSASDRNFLATTFVPSDLHNAYKGAQDSITSRVPQYLSPVTALPNLKLDSPSNTLNFQIPQYDGCIDSRTFRLHMNITVKVDPSIVTQGWVKLDNAGWGAMISQINLFESNQLIEQITDAGALQAMLNQQAPEDYVESVLRVTEGTCYTEEQVPYHASDIDEVEPHVAGHTNYPVQATGKQNLYGPVGRPGGKYLMFILPDADLTEIARGTCILNTSCSINLPLGFFNTNKPVHSYMLNGLRLELVFGPIKSFLIWPDTEYGCISNTSVAITNAELRYDLLSLSNDYRAGMIELVRELGSFEYPFDTYRMTTNYITTQQNQIVKISASGGSILQSITFGFIEQAPTAVDYPTQSYYTTTTLKSYYFKIGGVRVPSHNIQARQLSSTTHSEKFLVSKEGAGITTELFEDNADSFIETIKAQSLYKSYALGQSANSRRLIEGPYTSVIDSDERRLYSYSFMQSYDQESSSGLVLADNSEISLVLEFFAPPTAGTRCIVALNYGVKYIFTATGQSHLQS